MLAVVLGKASIAVWSPGINTPATPSLVPALSHRWRSGRAVRCSCRGRDLGEEFLLGVPVIRRIG
jgi:hypothetical protein